MVKELIHDPFFLGVKSEIATKDDVQTGKDLLETLLAHKDSCVGMAANMIGVRKRIIAFFDDSGKKSCYTVMYNPEIIKKDGSYQTEEYCLSLLGGPRKCTRYNKIRVAYQSEDMKPHIKTYEGWTAEIIQHEIDHCNGVLI